MAFLYSPFSDVFHQPWGLAGVGASLTLCDICTPYSIIALNTASGRNKQPRCGVRSILLRDSGQRPFIIKTAILPAQWNVGNSGELKIGGFETVHLAQPPRHDA